MEKEYSIIIKMINMKEKIMMEIGKMIIEKEKV